MNSLKKPETVITLINTAALLGASIYFYKKTNNLELELNKHSEHLTLTVKKVKEIANTKKHIAALADAIKKLNHSLGIHNNDIEVLKEIIKYQNNQIKELQAFVLKDEDNKEELKLKENPHIQYIMYQPMYNQGYSSGNQQGNPQGYNQGYQGNRQNQYPQNPQRQNQYPQRPGNQGNRPMNQGYQGNQGNSQGYGNQLPPPQRGDSLIDLNFREQQYEENIPRQGNQGYPQGNQHGNQGYPQGNQYGNQGYPQGNQYGNQGNQYGNHSFEDGIDDEDAAIDAVRRAKQQSNDPLDGLL